MNQFNIDIEHTGDYAVIRSDGYINNLGGEKISEECCRLLESGCRNFILNLEKSPIVNSIGVSILIELIERVLESDGKLVFTNLTSTIAKTFRIMGLLQYAGAFPDELTALDEIKKM
ncbi:STAS domain-containing protein [bacterium]|nr:STAS domain-containing protein [candidate division CSSED10-310 bacterium]